VADADAAGVVDEEVADAETVGGEGDDDTVAGFYRCMANLPLAAGRRRAQDGPMTFASSPPTVEVLVFEGADELDVVGPFEVLAAAGFPIRTVTLPAAAPGAAATPATVRGANGLRLGVDGTLGVADGAFGAPPGLLVVPGGGWLDGTPGVRALTDDADVVARLAAMHAEGTVLVSVCTGAMLLAATGVLRGRPAVTNRLALNDLRATGADVRDDARVVDDGDVVTAGGPLAGIDLAIRLVERYLGAEAAVAATERVEHERTGPLVVGGEVAA
jgi:transcriptional regulator GlxA family with amidase domain